MTRITFTVDGQPVAKQRPRTKKTKNGYSTRTPKKTKDYESLVAQSAMIALVGREMYDEKAELSVSIIIHREDARRADIDNIVKSVMDGMEKVVYHNDSQVLELYSRLYRKSKPARVEVSVKTLVADSKEKAA